MLHQSSSAGRKLLIMIMMITIIFNSDVQMKNVVLIHASAIIAITPHTNLKNQQYAERKAIGD